MICIDLTGANYEYKSVEFCRQLCSLTTACILKMMFSCKDRNWEEQIVTYQVENSKCVSSEFCNLHKWRVFPHKDLILWITVCAYLVSKKPHNAPLIQEMTGMLIQQSQNAKRNGTWMVKSSNNCQSSLPAVPGEPFCHEVIPTNWPVKQNSKVVPVLVVKYFKQLTRSRGSVLN